MVTSRTDLSEGKRTPLPYAGQTLNSLEKSANLVAEGAQQTRQDMPDIKDQNDADSQMLEARDLPAALGLSLPGQSNNAGYDAADETIDDEDSLRLHIQMPLTDAERDEYKYTNVHPFNRPQNDILGIKVEEEPSGDDNDEEDDDDDDDVHEASAQPSIPPHQVALQARRAWVIAKTQKDIMSAREKHQEALAHRDAVLEAIKSNTNASGTRRRSIVPSQSPEYQEAHNAVRRIRTALDKVENLFANLQDDVDKWMHLVPLPSAADETEEETNEEEETQQTLDPAAVSETADTGHISRKDGGKTALVQDLPSGEVSPSLPQGESDDVE